MCKFLCPGASGCTLLCMHMMYTCIVCMYVSIFVCVHVPMNACMYRARVCVSCVRMC